MDQMKRPMEEMKDSMRRANQWMTLSTELILPSSCDHIATFKTIMHLQGVSDKIMCRAFPTMLKGLARVWFGKLPPNTITSF